MKALTIQMTPRADGQPGADVVLKSGTPAEAGATLAGPESLPPLSSDLDASLKGLRKAMLEQTGRIPKLAERGEAIGHLLLPGKIATKWKALQDEASPEVARWHLERDGILRDPGSPDDRKAWARAHPGYHTYLQLDAPDRDWIPWEFARYNTATVFLERDAPVSRFRTVPGARVAALKGWQIRVLVLIAAENPSQIGADEELRQIKRVLRRLDRIYDVDAIWNPSRKELTDHLRKFHPHVLHFIGHGTGNYLQIFHDKANQPWGPTEIAEDIAGDTWIPEVVYLNACRTQGAAENTPATTTDQDRQQTIVGALFGRGVPAVVAMQADVRGDDAAACAAAFYDAMLDGSPIDVACARGRVAVSRTPGRDGTRQAYLPVLTLTVQAHELLRHEAALSSPQPAAIVHQTLDRFVDRYEERRKIVDAIDAQKNVIVVRGDRSIGKSWLLCWTMDLCQRRYHHVRYLELGACTDWLDVLRALRDGGRPPHPLDPLGELIDPTFNWRLNNLAKGIPRPDGTAAPDESDTAGSLAGITASPDRAPNFEALACAAFHEALKVTTSKPLLLVLDQIEAGDEGFASSQFTLLRKHWIDPLVARGDGRVRVLLAIRSDQQSKYGLEAIPAHYGTAKIEQFKSAESHELLRELFHLELSRAEEEGVEEALMLAEMERELSNWPKESVTGKKLVKLLDVLWTNCAQRVKFQQQQRQQGQP